MSDTIDNIAIGMLILAICIAATFGLELPQTNDKITILEKFSGFDNYGEREYSITYKNSNNDIDIYGYSNAPDVYFMVKTNKTYDVEYDNKAIWFNNQIITKIDGKEVK